MSELVLRSKHLSESHEIRIRRLVDGDFSVWVHSGHPSIPHTLSHADACKLCDFLVEEVGKQAPKPPVDGPWIYLETDSRHGRSWDQFPTIERAKSFADKRKGVGHKFQAVAYLHQQLVPVVTTSYEWKEIG